MQEHERRLRRSIPLPVGERAVDVEDAQGWQIQHGRASLPGALWDPVQSLFGTLVNRFTRPSHALSFTFSPTPPTMATERRMRLRKGELRTCCPFVTYPEERPQVPEDRRRCALRPSGFEEEADTKCQTQLVP